MAGNLLLLLILLPAAAGAACLLARGAWPRWVAGAAAAAVFFLALWAHQAYGLRATPRLGAAFSALVEQGLDDGGVEDLVVRDRLREALHAPGLDAPALAAELAGLGIARAELAAAEQAGDPLRLHQAELMLRVALQEAARLERLAEGLERELGGLRRAARGRLRNEVAFLQHARWIPGLGVHFTLGLDGLGVVMVLLTALVTLLAVFHTLLAQPGDAGARACGLFLLCEAGLLGVFASLDLVVLLAFWVALLVPGAALVGGSSDAQGLGRGLRFALPGFVGALLMLLAGVGLSLHTPEGTFNLLALAEEARAGAFTPGAQRLAFVAMLLGCAARLPLVPLHGWLAPAHASASPAQLAVIHGPLVASGAYGLLRLAWPLCPDVVSTPGAITLIGLLATANLGAGALLLLAERDLRRLPAHAAVVWVGAFLLGLASATPAGVVGAGLELVVGSLACAAGSMACAAIAARVGATDLLSLGGLFRPLPQLSAALVLVVLTWVGLPGLGGFPARLLVFLGAWGADALPGWIPLLALAAFAVAGAALVWSASRATLGRLWRVEREGLSDASLAEALAIGPLVVASAVIGVAPRVVLDALGPSLEAGLIPLRTP
jgi:NADH-quinone oxidoreductase subunit M